MIPVENECMKSYYVSGLCDGAKVDDIFLIHSKSLGYTQDGAPFVRLKLGDRTGTIDAIKWDVSETTGASISNDQFIRIRGTVTTYNGKMQIRMDSFRPYNDQVDPTDFLPRSENDIDEMTRELLDIIASVKNPQLKALLDYFFKDPQFVTRFTTAPAAQKIHHAYIGGLIEHSLAVAKMCDCFALQYQGMDRDLLITGAILHDVGKIEEFNWDKTIRYSDSGHLLGHIVAGSSMVGHAMDSIEGFHPLLKLVITHIILSHHGQKEWGSPKRPKLLESIVLHYVEDLDAKINTFRQAVGKDLPEDESEIWTERHWLYDRPLFKGIPRSIMDSEGVEGRQDNSDLDYDPFAEE